jgi:hypothetical protein
LPRTSIMPTELNVKRLLNRHTERAAFSAGACVRPDGHRFIPLLPMPV